MKNDKKTVCFIIDDEAKALAVMRRLIRLVAPEWELVIFNSGKQLISYCKTQRPDVLFSDIEMPEMSGFDLVRGLKDISAFPATVFVTAYDHYAIKAIREDVLDYLVKPVDIDELRETVERINLKLHKPVVADKIDSISELTPTEKEVLMLLAKGYTSAETAETLSSSPHTINTHRNHILQKMGCKSILEVINELGKR